MTTTPSPTAIKPAEPVSAGPTLNEQCVDWLERQRRYAMVEGDDRIEAICEHMLAHLRALPSPATEPSEGERWVPVSERAPDHDGWYEVSSSEPWPPPVYVLEFRDSEAPHGGHWIVDGQWHGFVRAWRPLP